MASASRDVDPFTALGPFDDDSGDLNAVIDTPKGSRNKYKLTHGLFALTKILPAGAAFPFDFGFVPATLAEDGDPIDVLVLMDAPGFVGCVVPARLIGVIEAEQEEKGRVIRNDRLIAVATIARDHHGIDDLAQIHENVVGEIEHFFVSYNAALGRRFTPTGRGGPRDARALVDRAASRFERQARGRRRAHG